MERAESVNLAHAWFLQRFCFVFLGFVVFMLAHCYFTMKHDCVKTLFFENPITRSPDNSK